MSRTPASPKRRHAISATNVPARPCPRLAAALRGAGVRSKLRIGASDDPEEAEADRVAERVVRMSPEPEEDEVAELRRMPKTGSPASPRRCCAACEAAEAAGAGAGTNALLRSALRGGRPLSAAERAFFEPRFGADFSNVRVRADPAAAEAARAIGARAFAAGSTVVFARGEHAPGTARGARLMAHELAHVLQARRVPAFAAPGLVRREGASRPDFIPSPPLVIPDTPEVALPPRRPPALFQEADVFTIALDGIGRVGPSSETRETIREAMEPLARAAGKRLRLSPGGQGDVTLMFAGGGESRPCGRFLILGMEGGGSIFVQAHADVRVCCGPIRDPSTGEIDYTTQIRRVFDDSETGFGRFIGNTAVHELGHLMANLSHTSTMSNFMYSGARYGAGLPPSMRTRDRLRRHFSAHLNFNAVQQRQLAATIRANRFLGGMQIN
jgi:hypothetical protein